MHRFSSVIFILVLVCGLSCTKQTKKTYRPKSVDDAVILLEEMYSDFDKEYISHTPTEILGKLNLSYGVAIRNSFGLRAGNDELMKDCGNTHADSASIFILEKLQKKLRESMDENLINEIRRKHDLSSSMFVSPFDFNGDSLKDVIEIINLDIKKRYPDINNFEIRIDENIDDKKVFYSEDEAISFAYFLNRLEFRTGLYLYYMENNYLFKGRTPMGTDRTLKGTGTSNE